MKKYYLTYARQDEDGLSCGLHSIGSLQYCRKVAKTLINLEADEDKPIYHDTYYTGAEFYEATLPGGGTLLLTIECK